MTLYVLLAFGTLNKVFPVKTEDIHESLANFLKALAKVNLPAAHMCFCSSIVDLLDILYHYVHSYSEEFLIRFVVHRVTIVNRLFSLVFFLGFDRIERGSSIYVEALEICIK